MPTMKNRTGPLVHSVGMPVKPIMSRVQSPTTGIAQTASMRSTPMPVNPTVPMNRSTMRSTGFPIRPRFK